MAKNVWKKKTIRWRIDGVNVPKDTPGAKRIEILSKRYYGTLRTASGRSKQVPLTDDIKTSKVMLTRLQASENERLASGLPQYVEEARRPIEQHEATYKKYLIAKGSSPRHVEQQRRRIRHVLKSIKAKCLQDVDRQRILTTLEDQRKKNKTGISTMNCYIVAVKSFTRWAWRERLIGEDPLVGLQRRNAETDRRRKRRALTKAEFETLVLATQKSKRSYLGCDYHFPPSTRAMLYTVAAYTGLRASEVASLKKQNFDFEAMTFSVEAENAKNKRATTLPLSPILASKLKAWFPSLSSDRLFPGSWADRFLAGRFLKRDLKRTKIDRTGVDFHSLRVTFITWLSIAGVSMPKAQKLARHSDPKLTMNVYTSLNCDDLRDAVDSL